MGKVKVVLAQRAGDGLQVSLEGQVGWLQLDVPYLEVIPSPYLARLEGPMGPRQGLLVRDGTTRERQTSA